MLKCIYAYGDASSSHMTSSFPHRISVQCVLRIVIKIDLSLFGLSIVAIILRHSNCRVQLTDETDDALGSLLNIKLRKSLMAIYRKSKLSYKWTLLLSNVCVSRFLMIRQYYSRESQITKATRVSIYAYIIRLLTAEQKIKKKIQIIHSKPHFLVEICASCLFCRRSRVEIEMLFRRNGTSKNWEKLFSNWKFLEQISHFDSSLTDHRVYISTATQSHSE